MNKERGSFVLQDRMLKGVPVKLSFKQFEYDKLSKVADKMNAKVPDLLRALARQFIEAGCPIDIPEVPEPLPKKSSHRVFKKSRKPVSKNTL